MQDEFSATYISMLSEMASVPKANIRLFYLRCYALDDKAWTCKFELDTPELKIAISRDAVRPDLAILDCYHAWKNMIVRGTDALKPALLQSPEAYSSEKVLDDALPF